MKASLLIIEESGCEGKTEGVLEKVTLAKHFTLKSLEILYNVGSTKNAMLKVDPNLEVGPRSTYRKVTHSYFKI